MARLATRLKVAGGVLFLIIGYRFLADRYGNRIREQIENRRRKRALENEFRQLEEEMHRLEVETRGLDIEQ